MRFEWDDAKSASNFRKHGIDFTDATVIFDDPHLFIELIPDLKHGELRSMAVGRIETQFFTVIYTDREAGRRIISVRRSRIDEKGKYRQGGS